MIGAFLSINFSVNWLIMAALTIWIIICVYECVHAYNRHSPRWDSFFELHHGRSCKCTLWVFFVKCCLMCVCLSVGMCLHSVWKWWKECLILQSSKRGESDGWFLCLRVCCATDGRRERESLQSSLPVCKVAQQIFGKENKLHPQIKKSWGQGKKKDRERERDAYFYLSRIYI